MGKLAERYVDAARSGVYRVASSAIPLQAAAEANARVLELDVHEGWTLAGRLQQLTAEGDRRPCVVLIREGAQLAQAQSSQYALLIEELRELARRCSVDALLPFFALVVDPAGELDLPPLYKERPGPE
jgi:hypothetical protein